MLKQILVIGGAALAVKVIYDKFVSPSVPDKVLVESLDLDSDDVAFAVLLGLTAPMLEPMIRKVVPG